jgi:phosphatidylcholine synthase
VNTPQQPQRVTPRRVALAWGVHLFTATGAAVGVAALLAISEAELSRAALLMLVALVIDSVDGSLARAVDVERVLPGFDGRRLDDIVDYFNYVIVPVVFMAGAGSLPHWAWTAVPVLASGYGFSLRAAKTDDDFFLGFPSYWNALALYLWLLEVPPAAGVAIVLFLGVAVFVPLKYIYPSKLSVLFRTTLAASAAWMLLMAVCVVDPERAQRLYLVELSLVYPVYYTGLSFWLGGWNRSAARALG